jgi:hypothetical protein
MPTGSLDRGRTDHKSSRKCPGYRCRKAYRRPTRQKGSLGGLPAQAPHDEQQQTEGDVQDVSGAAVGLPFKLAWRDDFDHFVETR